MPIPTPTMPYFTFSSSPTLERILVASYSFPTANISLPFSDTTIPTLCSTSEPTVVQYISSYLFTSHVTMPIPTPTITQISSLVSTVNITSSFTELVVEFDEYIVVPLGNYYYSNSAKVVVRKGKKRSKDEGGLEASVSNQIIWTQHSGGT